MTHTVSFFTKANIILGSNMYLTPAFYSIAFFSKDWSNWFEDYVHSVRWMKASTLTEAGVYVFS